LYKYLIRPILFRFDAERIHRFTVGFLKIAFKIPFIRFFVQEIYKVNHPNLAKTVLGIRFENPVGLAAGFDKDAEMIDEMAAFGFGFIEIGTLTPQAQEGNPKPRLFRLQADEAIINRMGFNNQGLESAIKRLKKRKSPVIIGGNIGKNKNTPNESAIQDYELCFEALFDWVDYFVVNVSSPNTPNLRALQEKEPLQNLLLHLQGLNHKKVKPKPILLKIAPDLSPEQLDEIISVVQETKIGGIIATNTTIQRDALKTERSTWEKIGAGGLSGKPLKEKSTAVIRYIKEKSNHTFAVIGVGGINSPEDALEKLEAGADLVQIYTGFIYQGPALVKKIKKRLRRERGLGIGN
jgi:dihydroorotate dehydrogenase